MVFGSIISETGSGALQIVQLFAAWRRDYSVNSKKNATFYYLGVLVQWRVVVSSESSRVANLGFKSDSRANATAMTRSFQ